MIEAIQLTKEFGAIRAIEDVTFTVPKGRIAGFLGPNGAGKTTTMRILTGIFPPSRGRARISGFDTLEQPIEARRRLGYFPENAPHYPDVTVESYLHFVGRLKGFGRPERRREVGDVLESCGLRQVSRRLVGKLSKGYRQRVGLAQALLGRPEVLILDEPTVGLDPEQVSEIRSLIASFRGDRTILLSSHILSEVSVLCEEIIVIHKGRVLAQDSPPRLAERLRPSLRVRVKVEAPREELIAMIRQVPGVVYADKDAYDMTVRFEARSDETLREVSRAIQERHWLLLEMNQEPLTLEEIFLSLVRQAPPSPESEARP
jgi:ABC-2 type transport system ATP-binding protein